MLNKIYGKLCELRVSLASFKLTKEHYQAALFVAGIALLSFGLMHTAGAQGVEGAEYNDERIANSVNTLFTYIEGSFGALVMVAAGIGAILSSAFGQYRAALGCLVVAVGAFILKSVTSTFFNMENIVQD